MPEPIYVLVYFAILYIDLISLAMFCRMVIGFFFMDLDNGFTRLLFVLSEPAILPLRLLLKKMNWLQDTPLDMSFILTSVLLMVAQLGLSALI